MKRMIIGSIFLLITSFVIFILVYASNYSFQNKRFPAEKIKAIEIQSNTKKKMIVKEKDIDYVLTYLNSFELKSRKDTQRKTDRYNPVYRIHLKDKNNETIYSISFIGDNVYYDNKRYLVENESVKLISNIYSRLQYKEVVDRKLLLIKKRREARSKLTPDKALKGTWLGMDGCVYIFDGEYLYQDMIETAEKQLNKEEYKFRYYIEEVEKDTIRVSVYGIKGLFSKDKKLFDLYLLISSDKCNIQLRKVAMDNQVFTNEIILEDKDNYMLGAFDSYFFLK